MERFYLTFGMRESHEEHPSGIPVHPDLIIELVAPGYAEATVLAASVFDRRWSSVYEWEDECIDEYYRRKPLLTLRWDDPEIVDAVRHWNESQVMV